MRGKRAGSTQKRAESVRSHVGDAARLGGWVAGAASASDATNATNASGAKRAAPAGLPWPVIRTVHSHVTL
jgi:hypothetical protein